MEKEYKIEDGISIPKSTRTGRGTKYPWDKMKVGQSIAVPIGDNKIVNVRSNLRSSITFYTSKKENRNKSFTTRVDKDKNICRVWRIA